MLCSFQIISEKYSLLLAIADHLKSPILILWGFYMPFLSSAANEQYQPSINESYIQH